MTDGPKTPLIFVHKMESVGTIDRFDQRYTGHSHATCFDVCALRPDLPRCLANESFV